MEYLLTFIVCFALGYFFVGLLIDRN